MHLEPEQALSLGALNCVVVFGFHGWDLARAGQEALETQGSRWSRVERDWWMRSTRLFMQAIGWLTLAYPQSLGQKSLFPSASST